MSKTNIGKSKTNKTAKAQPVPLHPVVTRRFVKILRGEEKRYAEIALKSDATSPSKEWFKGWAQGTSNAMGWLADKLNAV